MKSIKINDESDLARELGGPDGKPRAGVFMLTYVHDADCPKPQGGPCSCDPEVVLQVPEESPP